MFWPWRLRKYDPDQPREPAGSPNGGQWTAAGGEAGVEWSNSDSFEHRVTVAERVAELARETHNMDNGGFGRARLEGFDLPDLAHAARFAADDRFERVAPRLRTEAVYAAILAQESANIAEAWAKKNIVFAESNVQPTYYNLGALHPQAQETLMHELWIASKEVPWLRLQQVQAYNDPDDGAWGRGGMAGEETVLRLNAAALGHGVDFEKQLALWSDGTQPSTITRVTNGKVPPFHDGMNDIRSLVRHELGHVIDANLRRGAAGRGGDLDDSNWALVPFPRASGFGHITDTHRMFVADNFGAEGLGREDMSRHISGYAYTNESEWFAETYAATRYGSPEAQRHPDVRRMRAYMTLINKTRREGLWHDEAARELRKLPAPSGINPRDYNDRYHTALTSLATTLGINERNV